MGLGQENKYSLRSSTTNFGNEIHNGTVAWKNFPGKSTSQSFTFRFLPRSMGWSRCKQWTNCTRILEGQKGHTYKCKRNGSCHKHSEVPGKNRGKSSIVSRQFGNFLLFKERWRKNTQFKQSHPSFFEMVHRQKHSTRSPTCQKFRGFGRWSQQMAQGQRRLYPEQKTFLEAKVPHEGLHKPQNRYVCLSRQPSVTALCVKVPTLAGNRSGCTKMPPQKYRTLLCEPSLENNFTVDASPTGKQKCDMHADNPPVGFKCMVAPTSKNASEGNPHNKNSPVLGHVQKLLGRIHATTPLAPNLHDCIRLSLESKQIHPQAVDTYLKDIPSLDRYDRAFKLFWAFCNIHELHPTSASLHQVAGLIVEFNKVMPHQARHAYAALLFIPGLDQLAFNPLLRQIKKTWHHSQARYATFYDASFPVQKLARKPLPQGNIAALRDRRIPVMRCFMLCRNIDLVRMYRTISMVDHQPYILIQRKGWKKPQWEAVMTIPGQPNLCLWSLLKRYVSLNLKMTFLLH